MSAELSDTMFYGDRNSGISSLGKTTVRPMRVLQMNIENFREIQSADFTFDAEMHLSDADRIETSTIYEALDLVLGPERLERFPPVEELDFYMAEYLAADGITPKPLLIELLLIDLSGEVERTCVRHIQYWQTQEQRILAHEPTDKGLPLDVVRCLRLRTVAAYNPEEDEFEAETYFLHSTTRAQGQSNRVGRQIKRMFGPLYLRCAQDYTLT